MSITDELRDWAKEHLSRSSILAIADRIDAAMAERYVELPTDADGEYIHIGDVMESGDGDVFTVSSVDYGLHPSNGRGKFWMLWNEDADFYECAYECRHHKQPTVEDVLREFAEKMAENTAMYVAESWDADERDEADTAAIAEFAAKLRLAGDAE